MTSAGQHLLIQAVQVAMQQAAGEVDPKAVFCETLIGAVKEIARNRYITEQDCLNVTNAAQRIYDAAVVNLSTPTPENALTAIKVSAAMFGPQFLITLDIRQRIIKELGGYPVWGVISTFGADTLYGGLTYPEAMHRAQIEALEAGREASVVLQLEQFQGPYWMKRE